MLCLNERDFDTEGQSKFRIHAILLEINDTGRRQFYQQFEIEKPLLARLSLSILLSESSRRKIIMLKPHRRED